MSKNTVPSKEIRTRGIVLRRTNYAEADRILNILTPEGRLTAIAKGVRKARSKLAGGIEMFSLIDFNIHVGRGEMGVVTGAKMLTYYGGIVKDFAKMELMGMILKRVGRAAESADNAEYFRIVEQCMAELNGNDTNVAKITGESDKNGTNVALVEGWFWLNLKKTMGEEMNLYRDSDGEKLAVELRYNWDSASESFVKNDGGKYGADEIKMLRLYVAADLKIVKRVRVPTEMYQKLLDLARTVANV